MPSKRQNQKFSHEDRPDCCGYHCTAWGELEKLTRLVGKLVVRCNHKPDGWDALDDQYKCAKAILDG